MFMETVLQGLTSPLGMMALLGAAGLTLVLYAVTSHGASTADPLDKLRHQARDVPQARASKLSRREESTSLQKRLERYKSFLEPGTDEEKSAARLEMVQAG